MSVQEDSCQSVRSNKLFVSNRCVWFFVSEAQCRSRSRVRYIEHLEERASWVQGCDIHSVQHLSTSALSACSPYWAACLTEWWTPGTQCIHASKSTHRYSFLSSQLTRTLHQIYIFLPEILHFILFLPHRLQGLCSAACRHTVDRYFIYTKLGNCRLTKV